MKRFLPVLAFVSLLAVCADCLAQTAAPTTPATQPGAGDRRGGGFGGGQRGGPRGGGRGAPVRIGPAAPVPAAVAMPRPTAEELTQINDALKNFIDSNSSPAAALLKKYEPLVMVEAPRANTAATFTQTGQRQGPRHEGFVEIAKKGDIDLLFHGDSITDWWVQNDAKKAVFDKYFGNIKTANFAIAGDTTQGVLWGLQNGEGQGFSPKAVMLMIGTNNTTGGNTPPEIAEGIGAVVMEMRKDFPNAKILLLAIFPRQNPGDAVRDRIAEVNKLIAKLDDGKNVFYLDIGPKFVDASGAFLPDTFPDLLHPSPAGYEIWGAAVKDKLAELMK